MFNLKFYYCMRCGNVAVKVVDHGTAVPMECCDGKMIELVPGKVDAAQEKHVPVIEVSGSTVKVSVGSVAHPMAEGHFIQFICLETSAGFQVAKLSPGDAPEAVFTLPEGVSAVAAYEHCNKHGLWAAKA